MKPSTRLQLEQAMRTASWISLCTALLCSSACDSKPVYTTAPPPPVTASQPVRHKVTDSLELTGNTQTVNVVQLRARVESYLDEVFFQDGQKVKKDQLLYLIQQNTYVARLKQADGNVLAQRARLAHAEIELARFTTLYNQKAAAKADVDHWSYERDAAQASLMTAKAQRDLAKFDLGYTWVTAPFSGRIDRTLVDPGNLAGVRGSTILAQLTQMDPLYVYFSMSEADLIPLLTRPDQIANGIKDGKHPIAVGLAIEKGYPHEGYLDFAAPSVSPSTSTLLVRGVVSNPDDSMLPGQFARVRLIIGKDREAILVPRVAVANDEQGSYVLVIDDQNVVERRSVTTGAPEGEMVVVEEGLAGDEWVLVKGLLRATGNTRATDSYGRRTGKGVVKRSASRIAA